MVSDAIFGCGSMSWKGAHARTLWHVSLPSGRNSLLPVMIVAASVILMGIMVVVPVGCTSMVSPSPPLFETFLADNETNTPIAHKQKRVPAIYTDQWAIHVTGGINKAKSVAEEYGFDFVTQIMDDYYLLQHKNVRRRSRRSSDWLHKDLMENPQVHWAQQQVIKKRTKRDFGGRSHYHSHRKSFDDIFNDPEWPQMWYLNRGDGLDMNVQKAWQLGYTGKGVVVTILDDGLEKDHPDIHGNYDAFASYDVNGHDHDPQPRYDPSNTNRHGTRCAGEVAAQANNSNCVVGIAFNARIGGVRMLDGDVTDAVEAQSVGLNPQHIDIYSASWGPDDDGKTVDGPAFLTKRAFVTGVQKGRGGLGSIYIWASGNGGRDGDSCNCDGYTNSIQTLSISSATDNGHVPWYLEKCSSTMSTTYSSGSSSERQILTTDLHHKCTASHTGTSASAPLAAGIIALALEANPKLTWRDVHHLVVRTARQANLKANDWVTNAVGRNISHSFGYGLMDALAMVNLAKVWRRVGDHHRCVTTYPQRNLRIPTNDQGSLVLVLNTDGCRNAVQHVKYLEHVQAQITLSAAKRGDIEIELTSPQGTKSTLLQPRARDNGRQGFHQWPFMSVFYWGEVSYGNWTLEVKNAGQFSGWGNLYEWTLIMYGTEEEPPYDQIASKYQPKSDILIKNDLNDPSPTFGFEESSMEQDMTLTATPVYFDTEVDSKVSVAPTRDYKEPSDLSTNKNQFSGGAPLAAGWAICTTLVFFLFLRSAV